MRQGFRVAVVLSMVVTAATACTEAAAPAADATNSTDQSAGGADAAAVADAVVGGANLPAPFAAM